MTRWGMKGDQQVIMQEIEFLPSLAKCYMQKPKTHWDFEVLTDYLIPKISSSINQEKKKREQAIYSLPSRRKRTVEHEGDGDWCTRNDIQRFEKRQVEL